MNLLGESPFVSWPRGATTVEELEFRRRFGGRKLLPPDYPRAVLISHLVLSSEPTEPPVRPEVPRSLRRALNWLDKAILFIGKDGGGPGSPYGPRPF